MRRLETFRIPKNCEVVWFGDFHIGSLSFRDDLFLQTIKMIKNANGKMYCIVMGDVFDVILSGDKRFNTYEQSPEFNKFDEGYAFIRDEFMKIKKYVLGIFSGNHELSLIRLGLNPIAGFNKNGVRTGLCYDLGCKYLGTESHIEFQIEKHKSHVYACHGSTSATTREGRIRVAKRRLLENAEVVDSDYDYRSVRGIFYAHTHDTHIEKTQPHVVPDFKNKTLQYREQFVALTGSFNETQLDKPTYAANRYSPMPSGFVISKFDNRGIVDVYKYNFATQLAH